MFVVSISDDGEERNFIVFDLHIYDRQVTINTGSSRLRFNVADLLDIVPIECDSRRDHTWASQRGARLN